MKASSNSFAHWNPNDVKIGECPAERTNKREIG